MDEAKTEDEVRALIEQGYEELCEELESTERAELVIPSELDPAREGDVRTVLIDAQASAMDYAVASSLYPHLRVNVPPAQAAASSQPPGLRVIKGRMSEPPPLGRKSEPIKIIKGSKLP